MRSTKVSIAARASAVHEESEGSGVPMDEETSPQDVSDGDMKSPAKKKGEGGKMTTAKKKSAVNRRKVYSIHIEFQANSFNLNWMQLSVEVFNDDSSHAEIFKEAFVYALVERCSQAQGT